jgi:ferritin-like metal-binding protein YciE
MPPKRVADEQGLLVAVLQTLLGIERRLEEVLPLHANNAYDVQFRHGIERHAAETRQHVLNLETALRVLGTDPEALSSPGFEGLEREHACERESLVGAALDELSDLVVLAHTARIEHLEIAEYELAVPAAEILGEADVLELLAANLEDERRMLDEGKAVSHRLTSALALARTRVGA